MVEEKKRLSAEGKPEGGNIINSLIQASEEMSKSAGTDISGFKGLIEDEIYGNIFFYSIARHNTMAITLDSLSTSSQRTRKSRIGSPK